MILAFVFGLVFAGLGFAISFVYERFLSIDGGNNSLDGDFGNGDQVQNQSANPIPRKGQAVDIVIRDEDLPSDDNSNSFSIGSNRLLLNNEDLVRDNSNSSNFSAVPVAERNAEAVRQANVASLRDSGSVAGTNGSSDGKPGESGPEQKFVPVRNLETLYNVSGKEAVKNEPAAKASSEEGSSGGSNSGGNYSAADENLDTLPDMDNVDFAEGGEGIASGGTGGGGELVEASFSAATPMKDDSNVPEVKDVSLIAKAISSVLASES